MTGTTANTYRRRLRALCKRLSHDLADLEVEPTLAATTPASVENEPGDRGDLSVSLYEDIVNLALLKNETDLLREVNDALERFEDGSFGTCESCGRNIPAARLEAIPYSRCCAACAATRVPEAMAAG